MRRIVPWILAAAATVALMNISSEPRFGFRQAIAGTDNSALYRQLNLLGEVIDDVRSGYVEKPDEAKLVENAIRGMVERLDPHSSYMDAKEWADMQTTTRGQFGGLGIEVTMENGLVKVVSPMDDTPASKAGILAGDLITQIDNDKVQGLTLQQAVTKMHGDVDAPIRLKIVRKGQAVPLDVSLVRAVIKVASVKFHAEDDVAYIRISVFNEQTTVGLKKAIGALSTQIGDKLKGYVIDLRNNPGGLLNEAISVSDAFLTSGEIVSTRGRVEEENHHWKADDAGSSLSIMGDLAKGKPVIVLINGGSASASEIVAGALQDQKRATMLGTRSFGKGSVQTIIPLAHGNGALRLTTARYYTPSGRTIQAQGIKPDVEVLQDVPAELKGKPGINTEGEASLKGHLKVAGQEEDAGSQSYIPPNRADDKALNKAIELLHARASAEPATAPTAAPAK